ncbi:MAG: DJ-1/PfpI family protein, partial [Myxococcota bacterium]
MATTTGILLFDDVEELDFAGPWEVLTAAASMEAADP